MKQKTILSIFLTIILGTTFAISSCLSLNGDATEKSGGSGSQNTRRSSGPLYKGDGGRGIAIAVPAPVINGTAADNWMPQLFQDLITGDMARYSAMTVLDRANERMVLAEQELSASGLYSDDDYIRIGNLTNAQYITVGRIANVSGRYSVSFRITDTETNEIKASFNKPYSLGDIESGLAAKETVMELLAGMGIELTEEGERLLLAIQPVEVRAVGQLAKGMSAEKNGNDVEALAYFMQAVGANPGMKEAENRIQNFAAMPIGASIRERANYAQAQVDKWNKIFSDLDIYMRRNLLICIYDFSTVEDKQISIRSKTVELEISPGVKVVPNRTALLVYKTVVDNWINVRKNDENKEWVRSGSVKMPRLNNNSSDLYTLTYAVPMSGARIGLYDDYGDRIADYFGWSTPVEGPFSLWIKYFRNDSDQRNMVSDFQVMAQHKYYDDTKFVPIRFINVPLDKVTDTMTPRIDRVFFESVRGTPVNPPRPEIDIPVMTTAEWQEWLKEQGR